MVWTKGQNGRNRVGEKWSDSSYAFELTGLDDGLGIDVRKREVKVDSGLAQETLRSTGSNLTLFGLFLLRTPF